MPRNRCTRGTGPLRGFGRRRAGARLRHPGEEDGFTIIESVLALGLIFAVLVALLHTMVVSSRGIVTGRQRNVAVGLANKVIETARGNNYDQVGLATSDTTLATDTAITTVSGTRMYENEPLVYATGVSLWPTHTTSQAVGGTTYTTKVYVTAITPGSGDAYKRVTTVVSWNNAQYSPAGVVPEVKLSSYVFNAQLPADPLLQGLATSSGGFLSITAGALGSSFIDNYTITDADFTLPKATADLTSQLVRSASGLAQSSSTTLSGNLETFASGSGVASGLEASATSVKSSSSVDNDSGTTAPTSSESTNSDTGGTIGRTGTLSMIKGSSSALTSKSAVTTASFNDDALPYTTSNAQGPASYSMPLTVSEVNGSSSIGSILTTTATNTTATVDRDDAGSNRVVESTATLSHPQRTLMSFSGTGLTVTTANGLPYSGMVRVGATGNITATANAGQGTSAPAITSGTFEVCIFDTTGLTAAAGTCPAGYRRLVVTPGTAGSLSGSANLSLNGHSTALSATVTSVAKDVRSTMDGATYERTEATLVNWFKVVLSMTIDTEVRIYLELDYGQVSARSRFCQPTDAGCIQAAL